VKCAYRDDEAGEFCESAAEAYVGTGSSRLGGCGSHVWPLVRASSAFQPRVTVEPLARPAVAAGDGDDAPPDRDADDWGESRPKKPGTPSRPSAKRWGDKMAKAS